MTEILNLSTVVERDTVNITSKQHPNGKLYELVNVSDLGPYEHQVLEAKHGEVTKLVGSKKLLTPQQSRALDHAVGEAVKILMPSLEAEVLAELATSKRVQILFAWAASTVQAAGGDEATGKARSRSTGAGSSRVSKRSSAAPRKSGSTRRRGS